jgi:hypothetical protein
VLLLGSTMLMPDPKSLLKALRIAAAVITISRG